MSNYRTPYRRRRDSGFPWLSTFFGLLIIVAVAASCSYAFTVSSSTAQQKVEDAGYSNVHIGSRHVLTAEWRCGKGYIAFFDFTAQAPNGRLVHGRICKGEPPFQGWRINY